MTSSRFPIQANSPQPQQTQAQPAPTTAAAYLAGLKRAQASAGAGHRDLQAAIRAAQVEAAGTPVVVNAQKRGYNQEPLHDRQTRLSEICGYLMGMELAGRMATPEYLGALDLRRGLEIEISRGLS